MQNVMWGVSYGVKMATVLACIAGTVAVLMLLISPSASAYEVLPLGVGIVGYYLIGAAAGALVGLFRSRLAAWWVSAFIGMIVFFPISLTFEFLASGIQPLSMAYLINVTIFSILVGGLAGLAIRRGVQEGLRERKRRVP